MGQLNQAQQPSCFQWHHVETGLWSTCSQVRVCVLGLMPMTICTFLGDIALGTGLQVR